MHERIRLTIIALNEAKALHRVEELHRARSAFTSELTLRSSIALETTSTGRTRFTRFARRALFNRHRFAINLEIGCRNTATTINQREAQRLAISQTGQTSLFNRRDVDEYIFAAIIAHDEAETLLAVEELNNAGTFADNLRGHTATAASTTTAAEAAAAATTAEAAAAARAITAAKAAAITAAETTTVAKTATEATTIAAEAATIGEGIKTAFTTEIIALVTSTALTAPPSIKTHALQIFPGRPYRVSQENCVGPTAFFQMPSVKNI